MKRHLFSMIVLSSCFLALFDAAAFSADSRAGDVEAVIGKYFKEFHAKNLAGMVALSAPSARIVDYGQSFTLDEWNWYMKFSFTSMSPYDVKLANFHTAIHGDIAYTSFQMRGGEPDILEVANAVLKRIDGRWRIDFISIEKGQTWLPWLRERVSKGQDVSNWYEEYSKENP